MKPNCKEKKQKTLTSSFLLLVPRFLEPFSRRSACSWVRGFDGSESLITKSEIFFLKKKKKKKPCCRTILSEQNKTWHSQTPWKQSRIPWNWGTLCKRIFRYIKPVSEKNNTPLERVQVLNIGLREQRQKVGIPNCIILENLYFFFFFRNNTKTTNQTKNLIGDNQSGERDSTPRVHVHHNVGSSQNLETHLCKQQTKRPKHDFVLINK